MLTWTQSIPALYAFKQWLLPAVCVLCGEHSFRDVDCCQACENDFPTIDVACRQCAMPLESTVDNICGGCLLTPPPNTQMIAPYRYESPLNHFIPAIKFTNKLVYLNLLAHLLADSIVKSETPLPDLIIPIPLHPSRLKQRGFNQALEIARVLSRKLGIPIDYKHCKRVKVTQPQTLVPADKRAQNMRNAFTITSTFEGKHVAIVDDVVTTGYTAHEFTRELLKSGAKQVDVWCLARTCR